MRNLPNYFIGLSTLFALAGMAYGMYMAGSQDFTYSPAHAHNNLLGWLSMAVFGLYYRTSPIAALSTMAAAHFCVSVAANLIFPIGIGMAVTGRGEFLAALGGGLVILSMVLFAIVVWRDRPALTA